MNQHMPRWASWLQDNLLMSFLMVAEGYILGTILATGWVTNLEDPSSWGLFHGVGVVLFYAAGLSGGGLAVRLSYKTASSLQLRKFGFALLNACGLLLIVLVEVWASLAERSSHLLPSPADNAVLALFGIHQTAISPTTIAVALFVPSLALFWGFAQENPAIEDPKQLVQRLENERIMAENRARINAIKARGWRESIRALRGQIDETIEPVVTDNNAETSSETPVLSLVTNRNRFAKTPGNLMTATQLRDWVRDSLGTEINDIDALNLVKGHPAARQLTIAKGQPWAAPKAAMKTAARQKWQKVTTQVASE